MYHTYSSTHDNYTFHNFLRLYGITQNPTSKEYGVVMEVAAYGNMRTFLERNAKRLSWWNKTRLAQGILFDLEALHNANLAHKNLHLGNILVMGRRRKHQGESYIFQARITDLGLTRPCCPSTCEGVYGVLPYIAPEILLGEDYTKAADIYSIGIILAEIASGRLAFSGIAHDSQLQLSICDGRRPAIPSDIPIWWRHLIEKCWSADPQKRPDAANLRRAFLNGVRSMRFEPFTAADINYIASQKNNFSFEKDRADKKRQTILSLLYT